MRYDSYLITGGAGFIGSNFVRYMRKSRPDARLTVIDALTYAGNLENIGDLVRSGEVAFVQGDLTVPESVRKAFAVPHQVVVNFAAESHVDRSIQDPSIFLRTNILGTHLLLETALASGMKRFLQVSTDEVYGSIPAPHSATETSLLDPSNPYSASKAGADLLLLSHHKTFGTDLVITRCTNNFGPYQFPEKMIPLMITNIMEDRPLPVYGDGSHIRDWIQVEDHCDGILRAIEDGRSGQIYNFGGAEEWTNLKLVKRLLQILEKPESLITYVKDRLGHDRRYSLSFAKARQELGWGPRHEFARALEETVRWYQANEGWWRTVKSGEYRRYYETMYAGKDAVHSVV